MPKTDDKERDFENLGAFRFPGRFDPRTLQNINNAGDGYPGLQMQVRNWVKYYLSQGVIEQAIHMNSKKITNVLNPTNDQDGATKKYMDDIVNPHIANTTGHIDNITDIPSREHVDLQNVTSDQHHVAFAASDARAAINDIFGSDGKADATLDLDANYLDNVNKAILDQITTPSTVSNHGIIYVDSTTFRLTYKDKDGTIYSISP